MRADEPELDDGLELTGDPLIDEIRGSRHDTRVVGRNVSDLAERVRWSRIRELLLGLIVAGVVAALGVGVWTVGQVRDQASQTALITAENTRLNHCLAVFAAATADRTGVLAPLAQTRSDALTARSQAETDLILTVLVPPPGATKAERMAAYRKALAQLQSTNTNYLEADKAYTAAADQHPPPPAPAAGC